MDIGHWDRHWILVTGVDTRHLDSLWPTYSMHITFANVPAQRYPLMLPTVLLLVYF